VKTYAAAAQAILLMAYVPVYSWFASRVDRMKLVLGVTSFFALNILAFAFAVQAGVGHVGVFFYVWVGIFSLSIIAQFWSYANDIYTKEAGDRLFPMIGLGMTAGSPVGAWIAGAMFGAHLEAPAMLVVAAALLLVSGVLYGLVNRNPSGQGARSAPEKPLEGRSGFTLVFASRYIGLIALLLIVLNIVNTTGEYILSNLVVTHAEQVSTRTHTSARSTAVTSCG
jgi:AAA family ATP:ADP antiporter